MLHLIPRRSVVYTTCSMYTNVYCLNLYMFGFPGGWYFCQHVIFNRLTQARPIWRHDLCSHALTPHKLDHHNMLQPWSESHYPGAGQGLFGTVGVAHYISLCLIISHYGIQKTSDNADIWHMPADVSGIWQDLARYRVPPPSIHLISYIYIYNYIYI